MKRIFMVIPLVFLCCSTVGCQQSEEVSPADVEVDVQVIKDTVVELEPATNSAHPIIGSWKLNVEKSTFAPNSPPAPKEETEVYREIEGGLIELTFKISKWMDLPNCGYLPGLRKEEL